MRSFVISWGAYGGFYVRRGWAWRVCLGWVAITLMPAEIDHVLASAADMGYAIQTRDDDLIGQALRRWDTVVYPAREQREAIRKSF